MKTLLPALLSVVILCVLSCTPEEPFINSFQDRWRLLAADAKGSVTSIDIPDQGAGTAVWSDAADSSQHVLRRFRDQIFLLHSKRPWIVIFDADTLRALDTIILSKDPATSIAFANATTAYVTIPTTSQLEVIDLTVGMVARSIDMPGRPMNIDVSGNQLCVTLPDSNAVAIVDSRTLKVEAVVKTADVPWYVAADPVTAQFCIVCMGQGKVTPGTATAATMQFLSATTRTLTTALELTTRGSTSAKIIPTGLARP